jgi:hypothetical protein
MADSSLILLCLKRSKTHLKTCGKLHLLSYVEDIFLIAYCNYKFKPVNYSIDRECDRFKHLSLL